MEDNADTLLINAGEYIRQEAVKNLLKAQERMANEGSAKDNIRIARFLFKEAKKFNNKVQKLCFEEKQ